MKVLKPNLQIAIDGPVASGKSIGAYELAKRLNILYVYTGAMYRAVAWIGLKSKLDLNKEEPLLEKLKKSTINLKKTTKKNRVCDILVNGKDITDELFSTRLHWGSSQVAVFPKIRKYLVYLQQQIAFNKAVVMEGRDITTVILPDADLKIYMTASLKERVKRRLMDLKKKGEKLSESQVRKEIEKRDFNDIHRKADPLKITKDSWVLNTSNLSIKEEVDLIIKKLKDLRLVK